MFLFRIGKEKWSYTLTMSLHKLKYSHLKDLQGDHQFKFIIKRYIQRDTGRGNHRLNFVATVNKKGRVHCDHKVQSIPLTLYFDKDSNKFNEKEMIVQGKIYNEIMEEVQDLGDVELDIAQYAKEETTQKFALQVELEGRKDKVCIIKFDVTITRNFDENAEFTNTITQQQTQKPFKAPRKNSQDTQFSSPSQKQVKSEGIRENFVSLNPKSKDYFENMGKTREKNKKIEQKQQIYNRQNQITERERSIDLQELQSQDTDTVIMKRPMKIQDNIDDEKEQSLALRLFQTQKLLKQREKELLKTRRQLKDQRTINEALVQQKKRQSNHKEDRRLTWQIQSLQTQLEVSNMKINQLQSDNRSYLQKLHTAEDDMDKLKKNITYYRSRLEQHKLKVAKFIQKALETNDLQLICFMDELISEE